MIAAGDMVYIKQKGTTPLKPGDKYTVYRTFEPLKDKKTKSLIGTYHYLTGVVEITKIEPSSAVATVVQSYRAIRIDDLLMPYEKRSPKIYLTDSKQGLNGKVITSETYWNINGDHNILFVDKGDIDGVKRGQLYHVYYKETEQIEKKTKDEVLLTPIVYGTLLVLFSEQTTSTVLVTQADRSIRPGALIGNPN
jgi:hypothetical protein